MFQNAHRTYATEKMHADCLQGPGALWKKGRGGRELLCCPSPTTAGTEGGGGREEGREWGRKWKGGVSSGSAPHCTPLPRCHLHLAPTTAGREGEVLGRESGHVSCHWVSVATATWKLLSPPCLFFRAGGGAGWSGRGWNAWAQRQSRGTTGHWLVVLHSHPPLSFMMDNLLVSNITMDVLFL